MCPIGNRMKTPSQRLVREPFSILDDRLVPIGRPVTAVARVDPAQGKVIGIVGAGQVVTVASQALCVGRDEFADLGTRVTSTTSHGGVHTAQGEARLIMSLDLTHRFPGQLLVAGCAIRTQHAEVNVPVAPCTTLGAEVSDGPTVVVTA